MNRVICTFVSRGIALIAQGLDGCPGDGWPADGAPVVALTATNPINEQTMTASGSPRCQAVTGQSSSVVRWPASGHHDEAGARPVRAPGSSLPSEVARSSRICRWDHDHGRVGPREARDAEPQGVVDAQCVLVPAKAAIRPTATSSPWMSASGRGGQPGTKTSTGSTEPMPSRAGVGAGEHAAGDGARADRHDQPRLRHRLVRAQRGLLQVAGHDARDQQQVGVARRGDEVDAQALEVVDGFSSAAISQSQPLHDPASRWRTWSERPSVRWMASGAARRAAARHRPVATASPSAGSLVTAAPSAIAPRPTSRSTRDAVGQLDAVPSAMASGGHACAHARAEDAAPRSRRQIGRVDADRAPSGRPSTHAACRRSGAASSTGRPRAAGGRTGGARG